ncbi:hypothetical protein [Tomitella gaofuii]|uniref:hypothetical protein n=1 Tax=Tomitella gaofuii TaxID=2760083 RepID=UPI0015F9C0C5|nr:hypothetical protein [Tomitella gaofuii]
MWVGETDTWRVPQWTAEPIPVPGATTVGDDLPPGTYNVILACKANSPVIVVHFLGQQCPSGYSQVGKLSATVTLTEKTTPHLMVTNNGSGDRDIDWGMCVAYPV